MTAILPVVEKVAVMLILIAVGFAITRRGLLSEKGAAEITTILIKIVTPCLIVNSLLSSGDDLSVGDMAFGAALSAAAILLALGMSFLVFRHEPIERQKVLRFSVIYSNAGFMGLPLVQAIVGDRGVVYGSLFVATFNLLCWTYGYAMMSGEKKLDVKAALLNPGIIGLAVGLPLFLLKLRLPPVLMEPVGFLAGLNTPLAMILIGSHVARVNIRDALTDKSVYLACLLRLAAAPALLLPILLLLRPERDLFLSCLIQAACPVAANAVLFAVEYHRDAPLAGKTVAVSTLLSIVSIPVFAVVGQMLTGGGMG